MNPSVPPAPKALAKASPALTSLLVSLALLPPVGAAAAERGARPAAPQRIEAAPVARKITSSADLIGGPAAQAMVNAGDVLLQNDYIRVIIRGADRTVSASMFGGHIIDADIRRPAGEAGRDQFGQLSTFLNLGQSMKADTVEPITSGLPSGTAGVKACGHIDLFDFLDLENAFGLIPPLLRLIPYEFDTVLPLFMCNTYTLGTSDRFVKIVTDLYNERNDTLWVPVGDLIDSGSDVELWVQNDGGAGYGKLSSRYTWGGFGEQPLTNMDLLGLFGDGVSYGYLLPWKDGELNGMSFSVAGVTVSVVGTTSALGALHGGYKDTLRIPGGGERSYTRWFIVGDRDLADVTDAAFAIQGVNTNTLSGTVKDAVTGAAIPNVRVTALAGGSLDKPVTQFYTDATGKFSGRVPPGSYGLIAADGFDPIDRARPALITPQMVTVPSSGTVDVNVTLGQFATAKITVKDGSDLSGARSLPARVGFYDPNWTAGGGGGGGVPEQQRDPMAQLMDVGDDPLRDGLVKEVVLGEGETDIKVPPGTWDVVVTHGLEYDRYTARKTFTGGSSTPLTAYLTRVVDTSGYLSTDLHVHAMSSPDSPIDDTDRVRAFWADGVDLLVPTDHDYITDYRSIIDGLGADDRLTSLPGLEMTTFAIGHFNAFPMTRATNHRLGGALDWADNAYVCEIGQNRSLDSARDNLSPLQYLTALDTCYSGEQVRQINHARGELQGYFTQIGLDLSALDATDETLADPTVFRMADGADLFDPATFEAFEVLNGFSYGNAMVLLNDAFALTNLGYPKTLTAVSDTHYMIKLPAGIGRTWIAADVDDTAILHADVALAKDTLVEAIDAGHATASNGPFVTVEASKAGSQAKAGMGETLTTNGGGTINLKVRIQHPKWMGFQKVALFVNPTAAGNYETDAFDAVEDLGPTQVWTLPDPTFNPVSVTVPSSNPSGASRLEYNATVPVTITKDSWIVVVVYGGSVQLNSATTDDWATLAFTSPLFIDTNNNGVWTAPCGPEVYDPAQGCAVISAPTTSWDDKARSPNHHTEWVDQLWERVQEEMRVGGIPDAPQR